MAIIESDKHNTSRDYIIPEIVVPLPRDAVEQCQYHAIQMIMKLIEKNPTDKQLLDSLQGLLKLQSEHHQKMEVFCHSQNMDIDEMKMEKKRLDTIYDAERSTPQLPDVIEAFSKFGPYHRIKP